MCGCLQSWSCPFYTSLVLKSIITLSFDNIQFPFGSAICSLCMATYRLGLTHPVLFFSFQFHYYLLLFLASICNTHFPCCLTLYWIYPLYNYFSLEPSHAGYIIIPHFLPPPISLFLKAMTAPMTKSNGGYHLALYA